MAVDDDRGEPRVAGRRRASAICVGRELLGFGVDDLDRVALAAGTKVAIRPAQTGFSTAASSSPSDW